MNNRIIDIATESAWLKVSGENLVIESGDRSTRVPLPDVAALIIAHPQITLTRSVLSGIAGHGGIVVVCDEKYQPASIALPLNTHCTQAERFIQQAAATMPTKKRLWQQIVSAKIRAQGLLLLEIQDSDHGLIAMAGRVRSGDAGNLEGGGTHLLAPTDECRVSP